MSDTAIGAVGAIYLIVAIIVGAWHWIDSITVYHIHDEPAADVSAGIAIFWPIILVALILLFIWLKVADRTPAKESNNGR